VRKLAGQYHDSDISGRLGALSDGEMTVFSLIAAGQDVGRIAKELGISRQQYN
jgi:FixJ family two-component response regulator